VAVTRVAIQYPVMRRPAKSTVPFAASNVDDPIESALVP
jgi:hypothetical protein